MSTDRELLEMAAKAIGAVYDHERKAISFSNFDALKYDFAKWELWSPLEVDGDAFRLFVTIKGAIDITDSFVLCEVWRGDKQFITHAKHEGDIAQTTREVIVNVAAEIGKAMP